MSVRISEILGLKHERPCFVCTTDDENFQLRTNKHIMEQFWCLNWTIQLNTKNNALRFPPCLHFWSWLTNGHFRGLSTIQMLACLEFCHKRNQLWQFQWQRGKLRVLYGSNCDVYYMQLTENSLKCYSYFTCCMWPFHELTGSLCSIVSVLSCVAARYVVADCQLRCEIKKLLLLLL